MWSEVSDLDDLPRIPSERLQHYFSTYKLVSGADARIELRQVYGCEHAMRVVEAAVADSRSLIRSGEGSAGEGPEDDNSPMDGR